MADQPDISVVLATYNRAAHLPRAIASVLAQEGARFELIVVDDASTDNTPAYLATLTDPRIRVISAEHNLGPSGARNRGLAAARGDIGRAASRCRWPPSRRMPNSSACCRRP